MGIPQGRKSKNEGKFSFGYSDFIYGCPTYFMKTTKHFSKEEKHGFKLPYVFINEGMDDYV